MRLLICEDYEDTRDMLVIALREVGWEVFAAKDGREALQVYHNAIEKDEYFDVLLIDIEMPRLNGFAVGVNVRNLEKFGNIPRAAHIYFTGHDDVVPPEQLLEAQVMGELFVDAYIRKPVGVEELIEQIEELLKKD